ncbi:MAG TPA: hypothetical protein VK866_05780 [Acidimicrobiales bacterium]|nr:hypothetical protein [Acidimicrobiales bacterium]
MEPGTSSDPSLVATRVALHAVAEHVLAPASRAATDRIGLRVVPGGFATRELAPGRWVGIVGAHLVIHDGGDEQVIPLTDLRTAAATIGVEPGAPADLYAPVTQVDLDAPLTVDAEASARLADWFALGDAALRRFVAAHPDEAADPVTLWPEHFDLATTAERVNYGFAAGDDHHAGPYLYIGPWEPPTGPFWNAPFGRLVPATDVADVDAAVALLEQGRAAARATA